MDIIDDPGLSYDLGLRFYELTVIVTDSYYNISSVIIVNVQDVNLPPYFVNSPPEITTINEHHEGDLFDLVVDDVDLSDELTYAIEVIPESEESPFAYDLFHGKY